MTRVSYQDPLVGFYHGLVVVHTVKNHALHLFSVRAVYGTPYMDWYVQVRYTVFMAIYQLQLHRSLTALMQAVSHFLRRGHVHFVAGVVPSEKVAGLAAKFAERYPTLLAGDRERTSARKLGVPLVNVFWWPSRSLGSWEFLLLADQVLPGEKMRDARKRSQRVSVSRGRYRSVRKADGGWTWELSEEQMEMWRSSLGAAARSGDNLRLQKQLEMLLRVSMFGGVRRQVFGLLQETRRLHIKHWPDGGRGPRVKFPASLPKMNFKGWYRNPSLSLGAGLQEEQEKVAQGVDEIRSGDARQST